LAVFNKYVIFGMIAPHGEKRDLEVTALGFPFVGETERVNNNLTLRERGRSRYPRDENFRADIKRAQLHGNALSDSGYI